MSPSPARRVRLVTSRALADLIPEDRTLPRALRGLGLEAAPAVWDDPAVVWNDGATAIVRTPWDYFRREAEFRAWLDRLESQRVPVWNPAPILRWSLDKGYLRELASKGVAMPATHWLDRGESADLNGLMRRGGWERAVVKPRVGGGAIGAWTWPEPGRGPATREEAAASQARLAGMLQGQGALVQQFVPEVPRNGELSLIFFAGEYSHAVLKRARTGDWRVQTEYGGSVEPVDPPAAAHAAARHILSAAPGPLLYARVDGVMRGDEFLLLELEILEPQLFLDVAPGAIGRFARAVTASVS